jgi:phosphopantetheinyl transferase
VENDRLFVGLSHTEGYCAAAVAVGYPVGIDVQTLKPIHSRLRRAVGEPREWPLLGNGQSEDETFMVLFSAKEAVLKGERRGFSTGKRLLQCHLQAVETQGIYRRLLIHTERNRWKVRTQTLDNGKAVFSLAVPQAVSVPKINFAFES